MPSETSSQAAAEKAIRLLLAARKRNQSWLAAQLHVTPFWVSRRMSGPLAFDMNDLDRIAEVFGLSAQSLLAVADAVPDEAELTDAA